MTPASHDLRRPQRTRRPEQVILFSIARQMFAIAAAAVKEIRSTDSLAGAAVEFESASVPTVRHVIERGHQTYYVVNGCAHFGLPITRPSLALILRHARVAVLVDGIERMTDIPAVYPLPLAFSGEERQWYRGLAYIEDRIVPVLQPGGFLTPQQTESLDRAAPRFESLKGAEGAVSA